MNLEHLHIPKDQLISVQTNRSYNEYIINFYRKFQEDKRFDVDRKKISNKIAAISDCNKFYELDVYQKQKIKDFLKTNLCKDKFCQNCKKVKQASRMARFIPEIQKYKNEGLFHLVLTTPNVDYENLKPMIKKQFKAFATLIEYLKGKKKITGIDFNSWGYLGAIRSLEVTYKGNSYHPHIHALICMSGDLGTKDIINQFSYSYGELKRNFASKEIIIQKIWYLLINSKRVTLKAINELEVGYSCMLDEFKEDDYHELFKYMTKSNGADGEESSMMTYKNFITLYFSLLNIRQIQGYGCFFRIKDEDLSDEIDEIYDEVISRLREVEEPEKTMETPQELILDRKYTLISRKKIHKHLRELHKKNESSSHEDSSDIEI